MRSLLLLAAVLLAGGCALCSAQPFSIVDYGAVSGDNSSTTAVANSAAIAATFKAAQTAADERRRRHVPSRTERWDAVLDFSDASRSGREVSEATRSALFYDDVATVLVPAGMEFTIAYTVLQGFSNLLFLINGSLSVSEDESLWASAPKGDFGVLNFIDCTGITVQGKEQTWTEGSVLPTSGIDMIGNGYNWWWAVILGKPDHRPHLMWMGACTSMVFYSLYVTNSPQYHFQTADGADYLFKNITIMVDVTAQKELSEKGGYESMPLLFEAETEGGPAFSLPTFPLNTDGIDPSAQNVIIEDFYIENYDDAVAVKPCRQLQSKYCQCASDMVIRHGRVKFSVGLTIGSVPPNVLQNCIRNITFDDIYMDLPIKMIYIKSNPGDEGTGLIEDITYSNIVASTSIWYPLWIGPQQQKQPANGSDTGCSFLYPLNQTCATNPLVTMRDIFVTNVTASSGLTLPGVILCDPANPCTNVQFENFNNTGMWLVSSAYDCHNAFVNSTNANPTPICVNKGPNDEREEE